MNINYLMYDYKNWLISISDREYDVLRAIKDRGYFYFKQGTNKHKARFSEDDFAYIIIRPSHKFVYKCFIEKTDIPSETIGEDEYRLDYKKDSEAAIYVKLTALKPLYIEKFDIQEMYYKKYDPRAHCEIDYDFAEFLDKYLVDTFEKVDFPDSDISEKCIEGAIKRVSVNRYERSSEARQKCLDYHGCNCFVCGLNFENIYGEIGKGFIHVHHIIPLSELNDEYEVDPINDLIPVCPNCHAMLHQKKNGKTYSWKQLRDIVKKGRIS